MTGALHWWNSGPELVTPGLVRVPVPMPTDGLRANNAYLLAGDAEITAIDPGYPGAETAGRLADGLALLGAQLGDLGDLLVTHAHRDHYPMAVRLRRAGVGRVYAGSPERDTLLSLGTRDRSQPGPLQPLLRSAGAPHDIVNLAARLDPNSSTDDWEAPDGWLEPGAQIAAGDRRLRVIHTPGHTRGHIVFHDESAGVMFTGDHVLPHITPSIGFEELSPPSPLGDFLTSLQLLRSGPEAVMLPGHGVVGGSLHTRIDELIAHHDVRLSNTVAALRMGAETAFDVAGQLTWTRHDHRLGDLDAFNTFLAILETHWHLRLLAERGHVRAQSVDGVWRYAP